MGGTVQRWSCFYGRFFVDCWGDTHPKTNMEPKNGGLEDVFPFLMGDFQVPC